MHFFRDELEKEAFWSPTSSLRMMKNNNRFVRAVGRMGARAQTEAAELTPVLSDALTAAQTVSPGYSLATFKAGLAKRALRKAGVGKSMATAATVEGGLTPFRTINPLDVQGPVAQKLMGYGGDAVNALGNFV
jgi:hypothetical protein